MVNDMLADIERLTKELRTGKKTVNEVRRECGLAPIENGDDLLVVKSDYEPGKN